MDDQKHDGDKVDDVMMPGFRFHPTDEELVGFYLKRKIQQRPLAIELIKQVDIYKYDPWDLPKLASNGEKEWYFYCPRDRKYRNSARPNRVTGSGFWKATGTDRPIYTSDGTKCIGLKKSLVFYRGRAAKGIKTDWMMHEFRLPSSSDSSPPPKKLMDKALPPNDAWAICRIFKKTNSIAQRALAHAWLAPFSEVPNDIFSQGPPYAPFSSETVSCTTETGSSMQLSDNNDFQPNSNPTFSPIDIPSSKPLNTTMCYKPSFLDTTNSEQYPCNFMFSQPELSGPIYNLLQNFPGDLKASENINFEGSQFGNFSMSSSPEVQDHGITIDIEEAELRKHQSVTDGNGNDQWLNVKMMGFPFSLPSAIGDSWNSSNSPSEFSANYSTSKCYT